MKITKVYSGGEVDYFDFFSSDHINLIEIYSMLKELWIYGVHADMWYKLLNITMNKGCLNCRVMWKCYYCVH